MDYPDLNGFSGKIPRNAPCPCGSGKKYKKCCGANAGSPERAERESGLPEGVTEFFKDSPFPLASKIACWRMELPLPDEDEWEDEDELTDWAVEKVLEGFLRPYAHRHTRLDTHGQKGNFQIAILQTRFRDGETLVECPTVQLAKQSRMFDVFREKLEEFFANFFDSPFVCEVSHDMMHGGPILILEDRDGLKEIFMVAIPDPEE